MLLRPLPVAVLALSLGCAPTLPSQEEYPLGEDSKQQEGVPAGTVTADVSGTSFLPALVVPIPLIARTQTAACKGLAQQLRAFIVQ